MRIIGLTGPNDPNWCEAQRGHVEGWYAREAEREPCVTECSRCSSEYDPEEFPDGCPYCEVDDKKEDES